MQEENKKEEIEKKEEELVEEGTENRHEDRGGEENTKLKLAAIFIVAVLVGVVLKTQATKVFTMGFDDYKLDGYKSNFDLKKKVETTDSTQQETDNNELGNDEPNQDVKN